MTAPSHLTPAQRAEYDRAHAEATAMDDGGYANPAAVAHARAMTAAERVAA